MKIFLLAALLVPQITLASKEVVYGEDNRLDNYQVKDAALLKMAQATAGMIPGNIFAKASVANYFNLNTTTTSGQSDNLCSSEKFYSQITAPICSAFLVAPDVLVSAGHCFKLVGDTDKVCKSFVWVFDYKMTSATSDPTKNIPVTNMYLCKKVTSVQLTDTLDYSIIKLDRPVVGRSPVAYRTSGKVDDKASLVVIGHPSGLPQKISPNGKVTNNTDATKFATTLDTFHGNSGSAVFDAKTGSIEGILIQGKTDYVPSIPSNPKSCQVVNKCKDDGRTCTMSKEDKSVAAGEVVLRITAISSFIQQAIQAK
jgi:V8-like Glu-specific endopeptidase